jgi:large subunit ribosomal protein L16
MGVYISRKTNYNKIHRKTNGLGKGSPEYWVVVVKPCRILYEMSEVFETVARVVTSIAASKMPIRSQFL